MMAVVKCQARHMVVTAESLPQVAPKLMKTKPVVSLARYFVERQF